MLLSSGVVWRYLECEDFRAECPGGDPALQRLIWERLDDALEWLESLGAPVWQDTGNPRTTGKRFDPRALTELLARDVQLGTPLPADAEPPLVLATGGFPVRLARERGCSSARTRGARATGSTFGARARRRRPAASTSSTAGRCRRRRRGSARRTSSRSRSSTAAGRAS